MKIDLDYLLESKIKPYLDLEREILEAADDLVAQVPELQREEDDEEKEVIETVAKLITRTLADDLLDIWHIYHNKYNFSEKVKSLFRD